MQPSGKRKKKVCTFGTGHMTKMATMPIYGKNLKKYSSQEPQADCLETYYVVSGILVLQDYINDDPWLTLTYFMSRSNLVPAKS